MALTFNGTSAYVAHGSGSSLSFTAITIAGWVYTTSLAADSYWWTKTANDWSVENFLGVRSSGNQRIELGFDTIYAVAEDTDAAVTTNKWWFLAATFDGTNPAKLYRGDLTTRVAEVGGYSVQTTPSTTQTDNSAVQCHIGVINPSIGSFGWVGQIDRVSIFNRALSAAELAQVQWHGPHGVSGLTLAAVYGWASPVPDWSGNVNTGTVTVATYAAGAPIRSPFGGFYREGDAYVVAAAAANSWPGYRAKLGWI